MKTWDIIVPIKDSEGRIIDWKIIARVMAKTADSAIEFAKKNYGIESDVRRSER